jgi:broad specificity phosphatase PhoE
MEADYDQLHPQGEVQARLLGEHLGRIGQRYDSVYVGPLRRQRETLRLMREAAAEVGRAWPEETVLDGLAEGPFEMLMRNHVRPRLAHDARVQALAQVIRQPPQPGAREAALAGLFDHMIDLWRRSEIAAAELETAAAFEARVFAALERIRAREGLGRDVAVVTSNGVIGQLLQRGGLTYSVDGARMRLYNTSISLLELDAASVSMRAHNLTEHLSDPQHLTTI